jgi:hypothetical protein
MRYPDATWHMVLTKIEQGMCNTDVTARYARDKLLQYSDMWGLADYPATADQLAYRQALRDITAQAGFPNEVVWPTKPE